MKNKIVSISSTNTDYYAWGRNCAFLGYDREGTMNVLYPYDGMINSWGISKENEDLFWEGYYENLHYYENKNLPKIKILSNL